MASTHFPLYIVNAFSREPFGGNPAAVVPLQQWISDHQMQAMAAQHNLSETAFLVAEGDGYRIRWFTPAVEVDLCGHATLAAAKVLFEKLGYAEPAIRFQSRSGLLRVERDSKGKIVLDFPANPPYPVPFDPRIEQGLGIKPLAIFGSRFDFLAVLETPEQVEGLQPDFSILKKLPSRGLLVTAPGRAVDFVSRGFFPQTGIDEDPVTGSAHTVLVPYWAARLGKAELTAWQVSRRKGELWCALAADRVLIAGDATIYMEGKIQIIPS